MKTISRARKTGKAFTLVELLVVIAIIGILAALVLPRVGSALQNARIMEASVRAKNIVQSIFTKDAASIYQTSTSAWPRSGGFSVADWRFSNSTEYFRELVTNGTMSVNYQFFAVPRVPQAATEATFRPENNSWCVVAGITDSYPETAPAVFTRNLNLPNRMSDPLISGGNVNLADDREPFGSRGFAFATKGGSAFGLKETDVTPDPFTNIFTVLDSRSNVLTNDILRPGPGF